MIIPVIKTKREHHEPNNNGGSKPRPKTFKPIDFEGLPVFEFFKDLYHKKDALFHIYAYTTIRDVRGEFINIKPNGYWNDKKRCLESALQYLSKNNWHKNESSAYNAARKNGWWEECTAHMTNKHKSSGFWTKDKCIEDALKYSKKTDWSNNNGSAYVIAKNNGWMDDCTKHMTKLQIQVPRGYWTNDKCLESALQYNTIKEWVKNDNAALQAARELKVKPNAC